jgi:NAD(P)-dependent dehydrogenase (short-subunit alcohol dehydrogenase family)
MNISFENRVVLITGASSGIGEATAHQFAALGAQLCLSGRNQTTLNQIKSEVLNKTPDCIIQSGDITDTDFRISLIKKVIDTYQRLDVLVNAAGIIANGTIENTSLNEFDYMMDLNLRSVFHLIQLAVPYIKRTRGNIINVSSVTGIRAFPGILAYCVSKAGVDQLTRCAALELATSGVRVNAVNPGVVKTNLHLRGGMNSDTYQKFLKHSETTHPLGRIGKPEEIANLIVFLASDLAKWITGVTYSVDGGRHQTCAR